MHQSSPKGQEMFTMIRKFIQVFLNKSKRLKSKKEIRDFSSPAKRITANKKRLLEFIDFFLGFTATAFVEALLIRLKLLEQAKKFSGMLLLFTGYITKHINS